LEIGVHPMKLIQWSNTDASYNLAAEEYIFTNLDQHQDYLLLWQNRNAVIVGRHQNTIEEINQDYVKNHGIQVVRRMSGGGAVYHDLGNLNYSLIVNTQTSLYDFKELSLPVVRALRNLGVNAEFTGRNDLVIDGRKISGAAQMIKQGRLLHHGTLLFHSDLEMLQKVLTVKIDKIESKGIKSVRSRVTNICDHAPDLTIEGFKTELIRILQSEQDLTLEDLSREDDLGITALADSKYRTWDWNFGQSPEYNIRKDVRFNSGGMSIYLTVNKGIIESIHFYGDYFGDGDIEEIERALQNTKIQPEAVNQILLKFDIASYIHGLTADELTRFIVD